MAERERPSAVGTMPGTAPRLTGERPRKLTGTVIDGRIRVGEMIGSGGMGVVYEGEHLGLQARVAIKVLHQGGDARSVERFRTEARALANLRHPHIVQVLDFGVTDEGTSYMVSELLDGRSADLILNEHGHLPWRWVLQLTTQLLSALEFAHELGVIHRDVKPSNCLCLAFESSDVAPVVKLLDFGVAKLLGDDIARPKSTQAGEIIGTAAYMSPEQASGATIDARSDLYSVGATAFELLTGVPLFQGSTTVDLLWQHVHAAPKSPREVNPQAEVPAEVTEAILHSVEKDPDARFQTAREFREAVDALLALDESAFSVRPRGGSRARLPRRGLVAGGAGLLACSAAAWWALGATGEAPTSCSALLASDPGAPSGVYRIDPDGESGEDGFDAYCDMERDGGGWTLAAKIHRTQAQGMAGAQNFLSQKINEHLLLGDEPPPNTEPLVSSHGRARLSALVSSAETSRMVLIAQDDPTQRASWFKTVDPEGFFAWFTAEPHEATTVCADVEMQRECHSGHISSEERELSGAEGRVTVLEGMNLAAHGYPADGDIHVRLSLDSFNHLAGVCSYTFFDESWKDSLDGHWGNGLEIWLR
jgi:hypothetical protein